MVKLPPRIQKQTTGQIRQPGVQKKKKTAQATAARQVAPVDGVDDPTSQSMGKPAKSSPLAAAVMQGLEDLASRRYGNQGNAMAGLLLLADTSDQSANSDKVVSKEFLALRAQQFSKEVPGLDKGKAQDLLANIAILLAPPNS